MTILEIQPGAQLVDRDPRAVREAHRRQVLRRRARPRRTPNLSDDARKARDEFEARFAANPDLYGKIVS